MGVTIHYRERLRGPQDYEMFVQAVEMFTVLHGWPTEIIPEAERTVERDHDDAKWRITGLTKGIVVQPHKDAEPLRFEFDADLAMEDYCKTQFAGADTHVAVIELLRTVGRHCDLEVYDEAEVWETGDPERAVYHINELNEQLAELMARKPAARAKVRLPSGRIADLIE